MRLFVLPLLTLAFALPVFAVDGVREINQACAVNTGCFPGDTAAFPVVITASGSYRLTSDLSPAAADAINVNAEDVTIDLNGFRLVGAGCCTGISADATPHVAVRNGLVRGFQFGLDMGAHNRVENLPVRNCGATGIIMNGPGGFVRGNIVTDNLADELQMGSDVCLRGEPALWEQPQQCGRREGIRREPLRRHAVNRSCRASITAAP